MNDAIGRTLIATFAPAIVHETYYANHSIAPRRSKRVVTVYDFIDERTRNSNPKTDPRSRAKVATIRRADLIICISHNTRRDLLEFLEEIDPARVFVVHLGHSLPTQPRSSRPIARPYVLFVGRRNGYKNFSRLATAYAASSRLRELDLVSFGGGAWSSEERALFRQLDLDEARVHLFSGSDAFLATLYTHAAVFAYPSVYEGFGIPPLEAMGYGCATVCARSSSLPEVAGDATEYCEPLDVDSIRDALERALEPTRRAELIERGKARLANFTWDECAVQTLRVYQRLSAR